MIIGPLLKFHGTRDILAWGPCESWLRAPPPPRPQLVVSRAARAGVRVDQSPLTASQLQTGRCARGAPACKLAAESTFTVAEPLVRGGSWKCVEDAFCTVAQVAGFVRGASLTRRVYSLAADAVAVTVKLAGIARVTTVDGSRTSRTNGGAVGVIDGTGRRRRDDRHRGG